MERVIFSVIFFMMLGVPFYLLYKIARDILVPPVLVSLHNCLRASKDAQEALVRVRSGKDTIYRGAAI